MKRHTIAVIGGVAVAAALGVALRRPMIAWFTGSDSSRRSQPSATTAAIPAEAATPASAAVQVPTLPKGELAAPVMVAVQRGLEAYERARAALAKDQLDGLATYGRDVAEAFRAAASAATSPPAEPRHSFAEMASHADRLAASKSLDEARGVFGEISRIAIAVVAIDKRLQVGWHRFDCSMTKGFGGWLQRSPDIANPYMGTKMPACGTHEPVDHTPHSLSGSAAHPGRAGVIATSAAPSGALLSHDGHGHAGSDVSYYTCPMHPSVRQTTPGKCPICGMDLAGVTFDQQESGTIFVDAARRDVIGIKTVTAEHKPIVLGVRAVGRVTYDETRLQDIALKVKGWIARLDVNATGQAVARGQRLLSLYSPELFAAQQEYLLALSQSAANGTPDHASALAEASAKKLRLLGLNDRQLDDIRKRGAPIEELPIASPVSGYVIAKDIVEGASVEPGQRLYRIAALDRIWVEAAIYESDLPHIKKGQPARVKLSFAGDREVIGKVSTVYPYLDAASRTGKVRIELANKDLVFKPDMYADVVIDIELGPRLVVPVSAVVYTGPRRLVFVDIGGGKFRPQEVKLGARAGEWVEITSGVTEGQAVVSEGNYLVAAESRIRSTTFWEDDHGAK